MNQPDQEQTSKYSSDAEILSDVALTRPTVCKGLTKGWENVPLSSIVRIIRGVTYSKTDSSAEQNHGNLPVLRANNIQNGRLIFEDLVYVPGSKISDQQKIKQGDIVLAMSSGSRSVVGKAARATNDWMGGFGAFCGLLRPSELIEERYVNWFTSSSEYRNKVSELAAGVNINNLKPSHFDEIFIPFASLAEQQQIAAQLDELLAQVDIIKTRLDTIPKVLKGFRQSVLAAAVSGKLTEDWRIENHQLAQNTMENYFENKVSIVEDKEKYFNEPIQWKWVRFGSQVKLINGDRGKNYPNVAEYVSAGLPFINTGHIEPNGTLSKERMNYITRAKFDSLGGGKIETNDLVYCLRGATMGKTAMVAPLKEGAIASSLVIVRPKESIITSFTYLFLISPQGKDLILRYDNGSAQPNLSAKSLGLYPLALPPLVEQAKIVNRVEQLFTYADQIEQRVKDAQAKVNHLTQSIIAKAFRGELTADWREQNSELISGENSAAALLERIKIERSMAAKGEKVKPTRVKKKSSDAMKPKQIIPISDALKVAGKPLSGQELLIQSGYPSDAATYQLEQFFLDVREQINLNAITRSRREGSDQDWFELV